jgi:hypothetical protein
VTFWARGSSRSNPPSNTALWVGKHVGEDPDNTHANETVGYIGIEAGSGVIGTRDYPPGLGADAVRRVGNAPPYNYTLSGLTTASTAIVSQAAMDDTDSA